MIWRVLTGRQHHNHVRKGNKRKVQRFNVQSKKHYNYLSLSHESNENDEKSKTAK